MGIGDVGLFLLSMLVLTLLLGIMIGWEIAIAGGSLGALVCCFVEASKINSSPLSLYAGIIFTIAFFLCASDSLRRIINKEKLKANLLKLTELHQQGDSLLLDAHNQIKNDSQKDLWWPRVISWKDEVCLVMNAIKSGDCDNWLILNEYITKYIFFNEDMSNKASSLSAWVEKLKKYVESKANNEPKIN